MGLLLTYELHYKVNTKLYTGRISSSSSLPPVSKRSPSFISMPKSYSSCLGENYRSVFTAIQARGPHYANKIQLIHATFHDSLAQYFIARMGGGWLWGVLQLLQSHQQAEGLLCLPTWVPSAHGRRWAANNRKEKAPVMPIP